MLAREAADAGSAGAARASSAAIREPSLPRGISPEAAVKRVLAHLGEGSYLIARQLAAEAKRRFPADPGVLRIVEVFEPRGKAVPRPDGPRQPDRKEEFDWLRDPPAWARGQWVALVGREVVAHNESLTEVERLLRSLELDKRPLVYRVD